MIRACCPVLILSFLLAGGCGNGTQPDSATESGLGARLENEQEKLDTAYAKADHLMKADSPMSAAEGTKSFNELLEASGQYYSVNKNFEIVNTASSKLAHALVLASELRGELLARFPNSIQDGEGCGNLVQLYSGPGRWIGPRKFLVSSP